MEGDKFLSSLLRMRLAIEQLRFEYQPVQAFIRILRFYVTYSHRTSGFM